MMPVQTLWVRHATPADPILVRPPARAKRITRSFAALFLCGAVAGFATGAAIAASPLVHAHVSK